jgi:hypothetical protein
VLNAEWLLTTAGTATLGSRQENRKPGICPSPSGVLERKKKKIKIEKGRKYTNY